MVDCYRRRLAEKKGLQGKSVVKFTIVAKDGKGRLDQGEIVSSTLGDVRLDTCMLHALTRTSFPVPGGDGRAPVRYPFTFKPRGK
jgi:TonB family protein